MVRLANSGKNASEPPAEGSHIEQMQWCVQHGWTLDQANAWWLERMGSKPPLADPRKENDQ